MLNVGMTELMVFGIIALLILGPDKLPEAARFAGKWYSKIKSMITNVQNDIDRELRMSELREQMEIELKRIKDLELKMNAQMSQIQQHDILATANTTIKASTENKNTSLTFNSFQLIQTKQQHLIFRNDVQVEQLRHSVPKTINTLTETEKFASVEKVLQPILQEAV